MKSVAEHWSLQEGLYATQENEDPAEPEKVEAQSGLQPETGSEAAGTDADLRVEPS